MTKKKIQTKKSNNPIGQECYFAHVCAQVYSTPFIYVPLIL